MNHPHKWYNDPLAMLIGSTLAAAIASPSANAAEWDTTEKVMFGTFVGLQAIDTAQTWKAHDNPDRYREANPIFGSHPNMAAVVGFKSIVTGGVYYLVKDMPSADRKLILGIADAIQFSVVAHNYSIGLKLGF